MSDPTTPASRATVRPATITAPVVVPTDATHRTWAQRLVIGAMFVAAFASFAAGAALFAAQRIVEDRNVVAIDTDGDAIITESNFESDLASDDGVVVDTGPAEDFPLAEPSAKNFLITGADNNSCVDPDSPYAGAFGDRSSLGERSDTIMMWRVNPGTSQVSVLSFPRDLWVTIAGRSNQQRINVAYERDEPQRLIDTIQQNFGIPTDHFIQIDFCAFKLLVDAVDGVAVPFERPVRDAKTGLFVPDPGCFIFDGDHALAYVRSRSLQYLDDNGNWVSDQSSDLGRVSRQQDFIRRTADSLLAAGAFDPSVVRALIETSDDYVVNDSALSVNKMLEFAGVLRTIDTTQISTYQIEARGANIRGNSVLVPRLDGENMQAILAVFQGRATLAEAPEQIFDDPASGETATAQPDPAGTTPVTTAEPVPFETLPEVTTENITFGVVPDPSVSCSS